MFQGRGWGEVLAIGLVVVPRLLKGDDLLQPASATACATHKSLKRGSSRQPRHHRSPTALRRRYHVLASETHSVGGALSQGQAR